MEGSGSRASFLDPTAGSTRDSAEWRATAMSIELFPANPRNLRPPVKNQIVLAVLTATIAGFALHAQATEHPVPRLVEKDGRYALLVDGAPFLMLGAQSNNSSDWPATLPKVWPAIEYLHANTLETPIYWEQFEPKPGAVRLLSRWTRSWLRRATTTFIWCCSGSAHGRTAASTTCPNG